MLIICITPIKHLKGLYKRLNSYGEVLYKPYITKEQLKKLLKKNNKIDTIFCNPNRQGYIIDQSVLYNSGINLINTASTGTNHIDLEYCKKNKIKILSLKNDFKLINKLPSTSELAFGLMINLLKKINPAFNSFKKGLWNYEPYINQELSSLTVGIIGYGRLGKFMAKFCNSFGMKVYINDPHIKKSKYKNLKLINIAKLCDVVSVHVHLDKNTKHIINKNFLNNTLKKPIIINTSRGEIVSEKDIIYFLNNGKISGYGCDVLENEFDNIKNSPIYKGVKKNLNIIVTPHIGGMSYQGQLRAWIWAVDKFSKNRS